MAAAIPASIDEVTAQWMSDATGWNVTAVRNEIIGVGVGVSSAVYRSHLTGSGCPTSVIVKLPALDPNAVFTSAVLRMYIREVKFFKTLAKDVPFRVSQSYYGEVNEETSQFAMVVEDLGSLRIVDQVKGMAIDDARRAVDGVAAMHAKWWGKADALAADGTTISLGDPIYPAVVPMVFAEGWEKCTKEIKMPDSIMQVGPRFGAAVAPLLSSLAQGPNTLAHGAYRAANSLFGNDDELVVLDFQLIGTGIGAYDLAYFITQSISADDASRYERELFDRWIDGLLSRGAPKDLVDKKALWEHYRSAALFCLAYPIIASRGVDLTDKRSFELVDCMNTRFDRAVRELNLVELLPA
ncbi:MAG: phosphotransferase [Ilumatobacteraceae bacterium]